MRKTVFLVAIVAGIMMFVAPAAAQNSVSVEAQSTDGESVIIDSVEIEDGGWVAVYEETSTGNTGELLGAESLGAGDHTRARVNVSGLEENGFLIAALHNDEVPGEFDPQGDPMVEVENGSGNVQDTFFVAIGDRDIHLTYADAKQQRREFQNQLDDLRSRLDDLEDEEGNFTDEINRIRNDIDELEQDISSLDQQIAETEDLLQQLEENDTGDGTGDGGDSDGDGSTNETDGNSDGGSNNETDDGNAGGEGLPGFTVVGALVALLTGGALTRRRQ